MTDADRIKTENVTRLEGRFDRVEEQIDKLGDEVSKTNSSVNSLVEISRAQERRLGMVERSQQDSSKTNWAPFAIIATLFVFGMGAAASLVTFAINSEANLRSSQATSTAATLKMIHDDFKDHESRQYREAVEYAYTRGRNERDIAENSHELDLIWQELFDIMAWKGEAAEAINRIDDDVDANTNKLDWKTP